MCCCHRTYVTTLTREDESRFVVVGMGESVMTLDVERVNVVIHRDKNSLYWIIIILIKIARKLWRDRFPDVMK